MQDKEFYYDTLEQYEKVAFPENVILERMVHDRNCAMTFNEVKDAYFVAEVNGEEYAVKEDLYKELPIVVNDVAKLAFGKKYYNVVTSWSSLKFSPTREMSFRELIDTISPFNHDNQDDFTLWKIVVLGSYIDRTMLRVCSEPGFGKDSVVDLMHVFFNQISNKKVVNVPKPTPAKMKYCLDDTSLLFVNEMANFSGEGKTVAQEFLLEAGSMKTKFINNSRRTNKTKEEYNVSNLSLVLAYNDLKSYPQESQYFDNTFQNAVKDRFLPLKFSGRLTHKFEKLHNSKQLAEDNIPEYRKLIRTILWYYENWQTELADKREQVGNNHKQGSEYGLSIRHAKQFDTIVNFILLYAKTEYEVGVLVKRLYNKVFDYDAQFSNKGLNSFNMASREEEEELQVEEIQMK